MKFSVQASDLVRALKASTGVVERRNTIPILANVKIEAQGSALSLVATDLDVEMAVQMEADVSEKGTTTVPAHLFGAFVQKLPKDAALVLEENGKGAVIKSGRSRATLHTLPAGDFPSLHQSEMDHSFEVSATDLRKLFGRAEFAISTEETRYYLNGVYWQIFDGKLRCVATDGHRLALSEAPLPPLPKEFAGVIVPRKTVHEVLKHFVDGESPMKVGLSRSRVQFEKDGLRLSSKLIDGTFPDYVRVIPTGNNNVAILDRVEVAAAVDRVSTVSKERGRAVRLTFDKGKLVLNVSSPDDGNATDEVDVEYGGPPFEIGFNSSYLIEILNEMQSDKVRLELGDPGSPALFRAEDDPSFLSVLMPMRI